AELAKVNKEDLDEIDKAEAAAKRALDFDGTNAVALMVLGDIAFQGQRFFEATKFYESLVGRTGALQKEDAVRVLVQFMESLGKTSQSIIPPASQTDLGAGPPSSRAMQAAPPSTSGPPSSTTLKAATVPMA